MGAASGDNGVEVKLGDRLATSEFRGGGATAGAAAEEEKTA